MSTLHPIRGRRTNEELFFEHYSKIVAWSLQISHQDRVDAEDLVQDFYIQIVKMNTRLAEVDEIEPYLFKILRNLHYSRLRQRGRDSIYELSVVDYDSLERSLAAIDRHGLFLVRAQLRDICEFICERKNASRPACVFILRFFLGYYPSEVMKVVLDKRAAVDQALKRARREAQKFLDQHGPDRSPALAEKRARRRKSAEDSSEGIFHDLRQTIFNSCQGACLPAKELERRYAAKRGERFSIHELSHLVSCKTCLDRVNTILGLPPFDERSPDDTLGRDNPPGGESETSKFSISKPGKRDTKKERRALDRRMRDFFEHRPEGLEICVDGESRAAQPINAEVTEFYFRLSRSEAPEFLEVFSEQRVRLAYLHVDEPTSCPGLEQCQHVALSDGRSLELILSFANDVPTVHIVYRDPVFAQMSALDEDADANTGLALVTTERPVSPSDERRIVPYRPRPRFSRTRAGLVSLTAWVRGLRATPSPAGDDSAETLSLSYTVHERSSFLTRPRLIFAGMAAFAIVAVAFFTLSPKKAAPMSAETLLQRAELSEVVAPVADGPQVIYQRVSIRSASGQIERSIHRDSTGRRKPKHEPRDARATGLQAKLVEAGIQWDEPLSARQYREWHDQAHVTSDIVTNTGDNLLTLTTTIAGADVKAESLTVRSSDFHPVARTISYRDAEEVEIAELDYAVLPWGASDPEWFEPLASTRMAPRALPHLTAPLSEGQIDEAELGAMLALHQVGADADKRVQIVRSTNGVLVKGIVESEERKQEIEKQLSMVPHVIPSIFTFAEMERDALAPPNDTGQTPALTLRSDEETVSPLEKYLLAKGDSRDEMSSLADHLSDSTTVIDRESIRLTEVMSQYGSDQQLTPNGRSMLEELVDDRKAAILSAIDEEEQYLVAAGVNITPSSGQPIPTLEFEEAVGRNRKLCDELVFGDAAHSRSAQDILPELTQAIHQLHAATLQLSSQQPAEASAQKER